MQGEEPYYGCASLLYEDFVRRVLKAPQCATSQNGEQGRGYFFRDLGKSGEEDTEGHASPIAARPFSLTPKLLMTNVTADVAVSCQGGGGNRKENIDALVPWLPPTAGSDEPREDNLITE